MVLQLKKLIFLINYIVELIILNLIDIIDII